MIRRSVIIKNIIALIFCVIISSSCFCKKGAYRADFNSMEYKILEPLNLKLLLPINAKVEYFKGKYINESIERNRADITLHTLYKGCLAEWSDYFYIDIEAFDKKNYLLNQEKLKYYFHCGDNVKKDYMDQFINDEKHEFDGMVYYVSDNEINFFKTIQFDENTFVVISAFYDKRQERKEDYSKDIYPLMTIFYSIELLN